MIWRVVASIASQIHCVFAFFWTKLHLASASASPQARHHHRRRTYGVWDMEGIRTGRKACDHTVQQPWETHSPVRQIPAEGNAFTQEMGDVPALLVDNASVYGVGSTPAAARFPLTIVFPMASMTVFRLLL